MLAHEGGCSHFAAPPKISASISTTAPISASRRSCIDLPPLVLVTSRSGPPSLRVRAPAGAPDHRVHATLPHFTAPVAQPGLTLRSTERRTEQDFDLDQFRVQPHVQFFGHRATPSRSSRRRPCRHDPHWYR